MRDECLQMMQIFRFIVQTSDYCREYLSLAVDLAFVLYKLMCVVGFPSRLL